MRSVFITGSTGYMGCRLIQVLRERGHQVRALVRPGSEGKLPPGCQLVFGSALDAGSFSAQVSPADTFVQLVGYPKPDPRKAQQFRDVDLKSGLEGVRAAREQNVAHFVYVSVAHPAPIMQVYIQPRLEVEESIRASGLNATIVRPWYVLGPNHRWPYVLLPAYWLMELIPGKRDTARRLGLVTLRQMISALVNAVENPARGIRVVEVPEIRRIPLQPRSR